MRTSITKGIFSILLASLLSNVVLSQCLDGETELFLTINTDNWGYETYWQITPLGNDCDEEMIAEGGNLTQVGCNGAGDQDATNTQGYDNQSSIVEGPICLTIGSSYTLHYIDDYGDGGANFELNLFGFPLFQFIGEGNGGSFDFTVIEPAPFDVEGISIESYSYLQPGENVLMGHFFNLGSETIQSVELSYSIDGGDIISSIISGLEIQPFTSFQVSHPIAWNELELGEYAVSLWCNLINLNPDINSSNDVASGIITLGLDTPNILDDYLGFVPMIETIAGSSDGILNPRDLDFHPVLTRKELWVVLKGTESTGGKTVKLSNAGESDQTALVQQDGNAWHFMSLPTGIAFSRNENFGTSPGVYDANHDGGNPFTGPSLWSSDPDIYAQESGGNGSHLDMLHESPYSMGIANEMDNKFWVTCGDHGEIMSYDFQEDHGPGNSDHGDGIIYKYPISGYNEDPNHEIPDHLIFDHNTGWLYACNSQQNRVIRINTSTGEPGNDATPHEATEIYKYMINFDWEECITVGLNAPSGIDIVGDRMVVSNYNTGDINLYDIAGVSPVLLGVIPTGNAGIMGIKIGPDGHIWFVNSMNDRVSRVSMQPVSVADLISESEVMVFPNPAAESVQININTNRNLNNVELQVVDMTGRVVLQQGFIENGSATYDVTQLEQGYYEFNILVSGSKFYSQRQLILR